MQSLEHADVIGDVVVVTDACKGGRSSEPVSPAAVVLSDSLVLYLEPMVGILQ